MLWLRVGGQAARLVDETLPLRFGVIGQETTGAGGFAKALRTVPRVLELAELTARRANANAWIVDFTNPVGIVTQALIDDGHRAIGLCNVAITLQRRLAKRFNVAPERVELEHVGLNHLSWERAVRVDGEDRLSDLLDEDADDLADDLRMPAEMLRWMRAIPSYYIRYYYLTRTVLAEQQNGHTRAQDVMDIEARLLEMYRDPALTEKPELLDHRGGAFYSEAAAQLIASLHDGAGDVQVVDVRNDGAIPDLPASAVVEIPATIDRDGAHPLPLAPLAAEQRALVQAVKAYEELTIEAARTATGRSRCGRSRPIRWSGRRWQRHCSTPSWSRTPSTWSASRPSDRPRDAIPRKAFRHEWRTSVVHPSRVLRHPSGRERPRSAASEIPLSSSYRSQAYPSRPSRPSAPRRSTASWLGLIVFVFLAGIGLRGDLDRERLRALANGLPEVSRIANPELPQEIVVLDRTGRTELARFGEFKREVVTFEQIPPILLDATTAVEDKTFWENAGFDPTAIVAAGIDSLRGSGRSVDDHPADRPREAADPNLVQDPERTVERKLKEIVQSIRLTNAYPGDQGKKRIITAYLNNNYYGNQSYGVKAAARSYFGKELADLTPGEAATLAALPQSPSNYDLVRNATSSADVALDDEGKCPPPSKNEHLVLEPDEDRPAARHGPRPHGQRPDSASSGTQYSPADLEAEKGKELELARQAAPRGRRRTSHGRSRPSSPASCVGRMPRRVMSYSRAASASPPRSTMVSSRSPRSGSRRRSSRPMPATRRSTSRTP